MEKGLDEKFFFFFLKIRREEKLRLILSKGEFGLYEKGNFQGYQNRIHLKK